jgi:hypothetical protein
MMAWLDDRLWCHPKLADLTDRAFRAYINSITYSAGMGTRGHLTSGQQRIIGAAPRDRRELISAGLWNVNGDGEAIVIHDWDEHNGKRDMQREKDRERKRQARAEGRWK